MTNAADVIAHLLPRKAATIVDRHTGLPFGWGLWLRSLPGKLGHIARDRAEGLVALMAARPLPAPEPVAPALGRWGAFRSLFYQGWGPPPREERPLRWLAAATSGLIHLLFFVFLLWVALVRLPPPAEDAGDSSRVRVEFLGDGTPEDAGGGPPAAAQPAPVTSATASALASRPQAQPADTAAAPVQPPQEPLPEVAVRTPRLPARDVPLPEPAEQPLQVTEVPEPTRAYVLPPPTPRLPDAPVPAIREAGVPVRDVPDPVRAPPVQRQVQARPVDAPPVPARDVQVREREVMAPAPQVRSVQVPAREMAPRAVTPREQNLRQAEIPTPAARTAAAPAPSASTSSSSSTANAASAPSPSSARAANTSSTRGAQAPASTAAGPSTAPRPGGWATPKRGDDWGASDRNAEGDSLADGKDKPGLYNADGSLRVPEGAGERAAERGAPGGQNDQWTRERLAEAGTWLQRPPYDYEPTSFDKYWVPNESLLAEWVRRNVREMEISIPGTNLKLKCTISVLQLGGGCGLGSLFPEPPVARPPPEIPVKRTPIPTDS